MTNVMDGVRLGAIVLALTGAFAEQLRSQPGDDSPTLRIRLLHPDQQAAEILRMFEGARVPHPAAALAGWKRATRGTAGLGKPLEAVIAAFNPEMAAEWSVLDAAELSVDLSASDGHPRWHLIVPRDNGTIAAAITALRLTDGADEEVLKVGALSPAVERIGPPGGMVAARTASVVLVGSSRDELARVLHIVASGRADPSPPANGFDDKSDAIARHQSAGPGVVFDLAPDRLAPDAAGSVILRRGGELLRGLACRRVFGRLAIEGDCVTLSVKTSLDGKRGFPSIAGKPAAVDPSWLEWIPSAGVIAVVSLAFEPSVGFWDWAFALADRVDRADPARAGLAPLRTRANLLAAAASVRPEADVWPHLKGITAVLLNGKQPGGRPEGLVVLHVDTEAAATRLIDEFLPRLAERFVGKPPVDSAAPSALDPPHASVPAAGSAVRFIRLGLLSGRGLSAAHRGRDVLLAWGDDVPAAVEKAVGDPKCSAQRVCCGWQLRGAPAPQRLMAFWPARSWKPTPAGLPAAAYQVLEADPPIVWWGWNDRENARDSIRWPALKSRVHRFLDSLPLDPAPTPTLP
jgi:hypothetical protein